ncbi:MAG TPA: 16S rRNA (guanine(966)-N(2))-methyltransferase RsmD [Acidimicrobiales bacterium]
MRVIGGSARGRALHLPKELDIRPTADRVREAMFDVLDHLDLVEEASVADLFAGSGALGIEAASRGASSVVLVDSDRAAVLAIQANLESTHLAEEATCRVVRAEAVSWCRSGRETFDVIFLDPPYGFEEWPTLLSIVPAEFVVIESNREITLPERFSLHRTYRYGTTLVTMARRQHDRVEML